MHNKSDPVFEQYANLDFAGAKPVVEAPALAELQGNGRRVALCENGGASLSTEAYGLWNKPVTDGITYQAQIREEW